MHAKQEMISHVARAVQQNCHIADANHAGDYTLCIYLLKMRELYRWEQNEAFSKALPNDSVGKWLRQREALWDSLEQQNYQDITIESESFAPFESDLINQNLQQHNLVYSGGMGINNRPHFFLAELDSAEQHQDYSLFIAGKEYARDMSAPPAMSQQNTIYIRKESFRRLLWEKLETWRWNKPDNALGRAFACYDCEKDLDNALAQMTDVEVENVVQHERGEIKAGHLLGVKWEELLFSLPHSKASLMLRAIRDHLADSLTTLPTLLETNSEPSWHFYFGNISNMRKHLFPSLFKGYDEWYQSGSLSTMSEIITQSQQHWLNLCQQVLEISDDDFKSKQHKIENLIEENRL